MRGNGRPALHASCPGKGERAVKNRSEAQEGTVTQAGRQGRTGQAAQLTPRRLQPVVPGIPVTSSGIIASVY